MASFAPPAWRIRCFVRLGPITHQKYHNTIRVRSDLMRNQNSVPRSISVAEQVVFLFDALFHLQQSWEIISNFSTCHSFDWLASVAKSSAPTHIYRERITRQKKYIRNNNINRALHLESRLVLFRSEFRQLVKDRKGESEKLRQSPTSSWIFRQSPTIRVIKTKMQTISH